MADKELDVMDLMCPMPIVKISQIINTMESGQTLEVKANDPAFQADIEAWCNKTANPLTSFSHTEDAYIAIITKK